MCQTFDDHTVDVGEHRLERLAAIGRVLGQEGPHLPRRDRGLHRELVHLLHVAGDPVDDGMAVAAEFLGGHVAGRVVHDRR
jgi:hypothetical protein